MVGTIAGTLYPKWQILSWRASSFGYGSDEHFKEDFSIPEIA